MDFEIWIYVYAFMACFAAYSLSQSRCLLSIFRQQNDGSARIEPAIQTFSNNTSPFSSMARNDESVKMPA